MNDPRTTDPRTTDPRSRSPLPRPSRPPDPVARRALKNLALLVALAVMLLVPAPLSISAAAVLGALALGRVGGAVRRRAGQGAPAIDSAHVVVDLGVDPDGNPVRITDQELAAHGLILGASGSGKTTTLLKILAAQIERGMPVVALDLKGSPDFAQQLAAAAARAGRPIRIWSPDGPELWNPLAHGNATELKDKLIATERFTEPHYQRAAERYVQLAITVLQACDPERAPTLEGVVEVMDPARLQARLRALPADRAQPITEYLNSLTRDQVSAIRGLGSRLAIITESHTGAFLRNGTGGTGIDLRRALDGDEIVVFSLNSSRYGGLAGQLGTLVIQDLVTAAGDRLARIEHPQPDDRAVLPATIGIDEFSGLPGDHVVQLIARARAAWMGVLVATQEFADMDRNARGLKEQIVGSTTLKLAHRQDVPESARTIAQLAGTHKEWEHTYRQNGPFGGLAGSTRRIVDRFNVDPGTISSLRTGELVRISKTPTADARLVRVNPPRRGRGGLER
jgi:conjugal transfer pilus assembly protein TraD